MTVHTRTIRGHPEEAGFSFETASSKGFFLLLSRSFSLSLCPLTHQGYKSMSGYP